MFPLAILLSALACYMFLRTGLRYKSTFVTVSVLFFAMIYVGRPLMLLFGANAIAPEHFLDIPFTGALACLSAVVFCLTANFTFINVRNFLSPIGEGVFPKVTTNFYFYSKVLSFLLFALSLIIVLQMFERFGSVQGIVYAAKISKSLQGTFAQRQIVALAAFFSITTSLYYMYGPQRRFLYTALYFVLGSFSLAAFSLWGSRLEAFVMISGVAIFVTSKGEDLTGKSLTTFLLYGLGILFFATLLYVSRLAQLADWDVATSRDLFTTTAISLHMTRFDSLMLVHQDFGDSTVWRDGIDFYNGLIMAIPREIWPSKPEDLLIGQWFRRVYEPWAVNGWTVGAPGEYLINFGWFGVFLGGVWWGLLLGVIDAGVKKKIGQSTPLGVMLSCVLALIVLPEGSIIQVIPRTVLWLVPIGLTIIFARIRLRRMA